MAEIKTFLGHQEKDTQNVVNVKALYKAMERRDIAALPKLLTENPTWSVCPGFPDGGVYYGMGEVFGKLYGELVPNRYHYLGAEPEVFIDGGNVVTVLGHYIITFKEGAPVTRARFSHTWKIAPDGHIEGVWQVADSAVIWEGASAE
ncbi:MAG: nuclear transport factor 2 family protein [Oscillospiraceae bacterium]|nr:nuclear transport factor 2 family protein [Oscillospiraceae bacterium]